MQDHFVCIMNCIAYAGWWFRCCAATSRSHSTPSSPRSVAAALALLRFSSSLHARSMHQMGSTMKQSIFDEQTSKALKNWRAGVKKKAGPTSSKHGGQGGGSPAGGSPTKADTDNKGDAAGTGLQAGAAKKAAGQEGDDYEFIKIDE